MQQVRIGVLAVFLAAVPSSNGSAWAAMSGSGPQHLTGARQRDFVLQWNDVVLEAIRRSTPGPPMVARALAIVHTCIYDAWAAYGAVATATQLGRNLRRSSPPRSPQNK